MTLLTAAETADLLGVVGLSLVHSYSRVPLGPALDGAGQPVLDAYGQPTTTAGAAVPGVPCRLTRKQVAVQDARGVLLVERSVLLVAAGDPLAEGGWLVRDVLDEAGGPLLAGDHEIASVLPFAPSGAVLYRDVVLKGGQVG